MEGTDWGVTVLHVDDDPEFGELVGSALEHEATDVSLDVVTVSDAESALGELERGYGEIDCVLADYEMPDRTGLDLLGAVRSEWPDLPFVLLTGKGSEDVARDAFREGATDYMQKGSGPDHYAVLLNRILNAVTQYRAQRTSKRYGTALDVLDSAVYLLDDDGRFVSANDAFVERVGLDRDELLGRRLSSVDVGEEFVAGYEATAAADDPGSGGVQFRTTLGADGDAPAYSARMRQVGPTGVLQGVVGTLSGPGEEQRTDDVEYLADFRSVVLDTSASLMSAETDEIETKIRWTLQSVADFAALDRCCVFETDGTERPTLSHEWTREDVAPEPPAVVDGWESERGLAEQLSRFENVRVVDVVDLPSNGPLVADLFDGLTAAVVVPLVSEWEFRGFAGFGTTRGPREWSDAEVSILRTVGDTIAHTLERQRRERRLRRQNERLDAFASVVSHDLRNPLNVADGFVDVARRTGDVERLERASAAIDRMECIIDDVLTLAREGRTVGETVAVDVGDVAEDAWFAVDTADATLTVDVTEPVSADPDRLPALFENLFRNAVDHGGPESAVRVGMLDGAAGFYVADDGRGIPAADRERVFREGYSTGDDGSGLGLAIVANVVDAHGWTVSVTESAAGGARFDVVTDAANADAADGRAVARAASPRERQSTGL